MERLKTCNSEAKKEVDEMFNEAEIVLRSYSNVLRRDQWRSFSKSIIESVKARLTGYLDI